MENSGRHSFRSRGGRCCRQKKYSYDLFGDTVNTASRMQSNGEVGKINISETTYELIKAKYNCIPRGQINAKSKGKLNMYFVE